MEEITAKQSRPEIVMNYCNLTMLPNTLLQNEYYQNNLQKLYLKRNCIKAINVSNSKKELAFRSSYSHKMS